MAALRGPNGGSMAHFGPGGHPAVVHLKILSVLAVCIGILNCGGSYFVGLVSNPSGGTSITGQVSAVSSGFVSDLNGVSPITLVTFVNTATAVTLYFCGDQHSLFHINTTVRADYTQGSGCSLLVRVVILNESGLNDLKSSLAKGKIARFGADTRHEHLA